MLKYHMHDPAIYIHGWFECIYLEDDFILRHTWLHDAVISLWVHTELPSYLI